MATQVNESAWTGVWLTQILGIFAKYPFFSDKTIFLFKTNTSSVFLPQQKTIHFFLRKKTISRNRSWKFGVTRVRPPKMVPQGPPTRKSKLKTQRRLAFLLSAGLPSIITSPLPLISPLPLLLLLHASPLRAAFARARRPRRRTTPPTQAASRPLVASSVSALASLLASFLLPPQM
jgi:hypothetical protein